MPISVLYINFIRHFQLYPRLLIRNSKAENVLAHFRKEKTYGKETKKARETGIVAKFSKFAKVYL